MKNLFLNLSRIACIVFGLAILGGSMTATAANETIKPYHQSVIKDCKTCHDSKTTIGGKSMLTPDDSVCIACHGSAADLAKKTAPKSKDDEPNPHHSAHYGYELSCTACHKQHAPSEVYCNNCHEFSYPKMKP